MAMSNTNDDLPSFAKAVGLLGPKTEAAMRDLLVPVQRTLFGNEGESHREYDTLMGLVRALIDSSAGWTDDEASLLLAGCAERRRSGQTIDFTLVTLWVVNHPNDSSSVIQCIDVEPPAEVDIIRVLSQSGSQKVVYLASWRSMQREVVIKRVLRADGTAYREMESFPLNLSHKNIIETHPLRNHKGELFFAELRLAEVLNDKTYASGIQDGANLLYDIASALKHLHDHKRVHGDVKPDNIGKDAGEYILLDFGICRPTNEFLIETAATGSLRTRAPELLIENSYKDPPKVDVWALGATIFNAYSRRFPLVGIDETIPRISSPQERCEFQELLRQRAQRDWNSWVNIRDIPEALGGIVIKMLEPDPERRASSAAIVEQAAKELPAFIRGLIAETAQNSRFSPIEELEQLSYFLEATDVRLVPRHKLAELIARLRDLQGTPGFSSKERVTVQSLLSTLGLS
jgi:serine/threonine protein kinase